eukprot:6045634-Pleurochrysis_carterae.AAC.1
MAFSNDRERGAGRGELLCGPAMLQIMQQCEERHKVVGGAQGSCKGEIHEPRDRARWNGNSKDRSIDEA